METILKNIKSAPSKKDVISLAELEADLATYVNQNPHA